jgi:hypothetical protein
MLVVQRAGQATGGLRATDIEEELSGGGEEDVVAGWDRGVRRPIGRHPCDGRGGRLTMTRTDRPPGGPLTLRTVPKTVIAQDDSEPAEEGGAAVQQALDEASKAIPAAEPAADPLRPAPIL